jgi:hypothetical protein
MSKLPYSWVLQNYSKFKIQLPTPEKLKLPVPNWQTLKINFQEMHPFQKMMRQAKVL